MISIEHRTGALKLAQSRHAEHAALKPQHFVSLADIDAATAKGLVAHALEMKRTPHAQADLLRDKAVALLFQKTSTRTRCSFERAAIELGAAPSYIDWRSSNFVLADIGDEIKTLSRYFDAIVARVTDRDTLMAMVDASEVPVVNGLCTVEHPCQALADYMTMSEYFGTDLNGLVVAYVGDGNNVCRSLLHGAGKFGAHVNLCSPPGYELKTNGAGVTIFDHPMDAVRNADVVYTDTWVSIGSEAETDKRLAIFAPYQLNEALLGAAPGHALVMHCLPAHPEQEITAGVLRGPRSIVFDQAENRKHAQKALLEWLIG